MSQIAFDFEAAPEKAPFSPPLQTLLDRWAPMQQSFVGPTMFSQVWRVLVRNEMWSLAVTQHFIVAVRGVLPDAAPLDREMTGASSVERYLDQFRDVTWKSVDAARLRAFCGAASWPVSCAKCLETGEMLCPECGGVELACSYCESTGRVGCEECDSEGFVFPEVRPGYLENHPVNLNLLASIFEVLEETSEGRWHFGFEIPARIKGQTRALFLEGADWSVMLLGLNPDYDYRSAAGISAPRFEVAS